MPGMDGVNPPTNILNYYSPPLPPQRPKKRRWKLKLFVAVLILLGAIFAWSGSTIISKTNKIFTNKENIFIRVGRLIIGDDKPIKGEDSGTVNVLLLGMGGPGHEGPLLTDTMIVASLNLKSDEVVFTSIPRDFLVQLPNYGFNKINAAYAYAEKDRSGSGGEAAIAVAEKVTGLDIPYFASIDFNGFVKAIDHVGGLDITIERTFTDSEYPDYKYGYLPPVTFDKGNEHMNGERALIFARSRKGTNGEGSDFARSERQKKIMVALKDNLFRLGIDDLSTINRLLSDFTENIRTNMEPYELKRLADLGKDIKGESVYSLSLEPQGNLICNGLIETGQTRTVVVSPPPPSPTPTPTPTKQKGKNNPLPPPPPPPAEPITKEEPIMMYVVQPCEGKTLEDIYAFLSAAMSVARLQSEKATIEVQNNSGKDYALNRWRDLANSGINIKITAFRGKTSYDRTILYDNSKGAKPRTLDYLKNNFNFDMSDVPFYEGQASSDFVIILGKDAL